MGQWIGIVVCSAPSHYLNQCWFIVNWTLKTNFGEIWIVIQTIIHKDAFENVVYEMAAILFRGRWDNEISTRPSGHLFRCKINQVSLLHQVHNCYNKLGVVAKSISACIWLLVIATYMFAIYPFHPCPTKLLNCHCGNAIFPVTVKQPCWIWITRWNIYLTMKQQKQVKHNKTRTIYGLYVWLYVWSAKCI